jgi:hypothetical protein
MPILVGITGYMGSGKTLAADHLCSQRGFRKLKMAQPLKDMLSAVGLTTDDLEGASKEEALTLLCDKSPRYAMQTLGTEWGRNLIGEDIWINLWERKATGLMSLNHNIVADDIRFENEVKQIRFMGGVVLRISRGGVASDHPTEEQDFPVDFEVVNNEGTDSLIAKVDAILFHNVVAEEDI